MRSRPTIHLRGAALLLLAALLVVFALSRIGSEKATGANWTRAHGTSAVFGEKGGRTAINAVIAGGPGLLAVGYENPDAAVWTSEDGLSWQRAAKGDPALAGRGIEGMSAIAAGGPGFVAVGGDDMGGDWDAAVWVSKNGLSWKRVGAGTAVFGGNGSQLMRGVVAGGPGLVAVGFDAGDAAVWVSRRDSSWKRAHAGEPVFGGEGKQEMNAVTVGGPGLVAVGSSNGDAAVWTSVDGISWRRAPAGQPAFGGAGEQKMFGVVAGGPGLVAVGYDNGAAAVWVSNDGLIWKRASINQSDSRRVAVWSEMLGVTAGGPGLVAVGVVGAGFGGSDAAVWTSKDGLSWKNIPDNGRGFGYEGNQAMAGVAAGGAGLVAVGDDSNTAAVWTSSS
ncbi:MAG: hypothetical protein ABSB96_08450 [Gaiellaceae bacterium]